MKTVHTLLLGFALAASSTAFAQYSWVGKDGRRVFSDQPPPADVPEQNVRSQPSKRAPAAVSVVRQAETPASGASAPQPATSVSAGVDKTLEEKKKQADAEAAAKQKAEDERRAAARADNCQRASNYKSSLDSGQRISRTNEKGEREILDDAQRAAELARVQKDIADNCNDN
jgi:hypothetical protein